MNTDSLWTLCLLIHQHGCISVYLHLIVISGDCLVLLLLAVILHALFFIINGSASWNQFWVAHYYCKKKYHFSLHQSCTLLNSFLGTTILCVRLRTGHIQDCTWVEVTHTSLASLSFWLVAHTKTSRTMMTRSSKNRYICLALCFKIKYKVRFEIDTSYQVIEVPIYFYWKKVLITEGWDWPLKGNTTRHYCDVQGICEEENHSHFNLYLGSFVPLCSFRIHCS